MTTKRFRYRVYPTPAQDVALSKTFGCAGVVFNDAVAARRAAHAAGQPYPKFKDLSRQLITEAKKTEARAWLGEVSAVVLQQALRDEDQAERNFFDSISGKRKGKRVGRPKFRSRHDNRHTARFTSNARFKVRDLGNEKARLHLPGVPGELRLAYSRPPPSTPSSVTLIRECDGVLFASFVVEVPDREPLPVSDRHAGVDLGLTDFAAVVHSDGTREKIPTPDTSVSMPGGSGKPKSLSAVNRKDRRTGPRPGSESPGCTVRCPTPDSNMPTVWL